jgi:hypothetical protein
MLIRDRKSKKQIIAELIETIPNPDYFPSVDEVRKYDAKGIAEQVDFAVKCQPRSVYKAGQAAPTVIIAPRSRGFSNRETLINKYEI